MMTCRAKMSLEPSKRRPFIGRDCIFTMIALHVQYQICCFMMLIHIPKYRGGVDVSKKRDVEAK